MMDQKYTESFMSGQTELLPTFPAATDPLNDHCYDSYYAVYSENEQEYFADDNPLTSQKLNESEKFEFSGDLGVRIKKALSGDGDDNSELGNLTGDCHRTPLKLKLIENYRNNVNVNTEALDSNDASWFLRYIQQQKVKANERTEDSDTNYRTAAACRRGTTMSRKGSSGRDSFLSTESESNAAIRVQLEETKRELALYQTRVATLEAERFLGVPVVLEDTAHRRPSRLYLPESESSRERTASSGYSTSSEYKEVENSIHNAVNNGDMEWLLNNIKKSPHSLFVVNQERRTALHLACMNNSLSLAALLIQHGSVVNAADAAGQTPMHLCSDAEVMELLCNSGGNSGLRDIHGYTPLYVHTLHGRDDLVKCLLLKKADASLRDPVNRRTALHCAAEVRNYDIMQILLSEPSMNAFIDAQDIDGDTALHLIVIDLTESLSHKNFKISPKKVQGLLIQKCLMLLLNRGAMVNIRNCLGDTPLHYLIANKSLRSIMVTAPIVQILLDMAADVNAFNIDGCTPLLVGAVQGDWEVCELLMRAGGDLNAVCSITSRYIMNNRQYKELSRHNDSNDHIATATCSPSEIIPREILPTLYAAISSKQSMVRKRTGHKCGECHELFDHMLPCEAEINKDYSFVMSLLGMELDVVNCSEKGRLIHNCGHCGRYLCRKCLPNSLLKDLMPEFFQYSEPISASPVRFSFGSSNSDDDSVPLCLLCYDILLK